MAFDFIALRGTFFDNAGMMRRADKMKRKQLSKFGAFVRKRMRSSMRRRKKQSKPGEPPSAHSGELKLIFFAWDDRQQSVVVGPIIFSVRDGGGITPGLLERGGERIARRRGRSKRLHYRKFPFAVPALEAEAPKFAGLFKGAFS